jgi:hypothetical protein
MSGGMLHRPARHLWWAFENSFLSRVALTAILGVGAYLRLHDLDLDWFLIDQARDIRQATGIVRGSAFPLMGPEVQGGPSHTWGPLYFYLLAIPLALSPNPARAAAFLSLLNLASVYFTYRFSKRFFGHGIALVSAALFATHPLAVVSGRGLWNLSPLPLFTVCFLYCLFLLVIERRSVMIVPAMATLACMVQLHLSSAVGLAVFALALNIYRPPIRLRHLLLGTGACVVLLLPYAVAQVMGEFHDVQATLSLSRVFFAPLPVYDVWSAMRPAFLASADLSRWQQLTFSTSGVAAVGVVIQRIEGYVMLVGVGYLVVRVVGAWATRSASPRLAGASDAVLKGYGLLSLWIWTTLVLILFKRGLRSWYYLDLLYPAPFIAGAIVLCELLTYAALRLRLNKGPLVGVVALVGVLLVALADAESLRRLWKLTTSSGVMRLPNAVISGGGVDGSSSVELMPIRYKEGIVRALVSRARFEPEAFYRRVHGSAFDAVVEDGGFFFERLARGRPRPDADGQGAPHYAVLGPDLAHRFNPVSILTRVGPFTIVEYVPMIEYGSWRYAKEDAKDDGAHRLHGEGWIAVDMPTRSIPDVTAYGYPATAVWRQVPLLLHGELEVKRAPDHFRLVVALRQYEGAHRVEACLVNGSPAPMDGVFSHATVGARLTETVFDLSPALHEGRNTVTCRLSGSGRQFDLDVYELHE